MGGARTHIREVQEGMEGGRSRVEKEKVEAGVKRKKIQLPGEGKSRLF